MTRGHVIHKCAEEPEGLIDSLRSNHGWELEEIPLNSDRHDSCPYCGEETKDMEVAQSEDSMKLSRNLRGKSANATGFQNKNEYAALMSEVKAMRKELASAKKKGGSD